MIDFVCTECNANLRVKDDGRAGSMIVCPRCKLPVQVPSPDVIDAESAEIIEDVLDLSDLPIVESPPEPTRRPTKSAAPRQPPATNRSGPRPRHGGGPDPVPSDQEGGSRRGRLSKRDEQAVRRKLASHFGLGDEVEVEGSEELQVYRARLQSLYERRDVEPRVGPHAGGNLPRPRVTEANIDPWDYENEPPAAFEEAKEVLMVEESQRLLRCDGCGGQGGAGCPACRGVGQIGCECQNGVMACPACGGGGSQKVASGSRKEWVECRSCNGKGVHDRGGNPLENRPCMVCNRKGGSHRDVTDYQMMDCRRCDRRGVVPCSSCGGSRQVRCGQCGGSGCMGCQTCGGSGKVVAFLAVVRSFTPGEVTRTVPSAGMPAAATRGLADLKGFRRLLDVPVPDVSDPVEPQGADVALCDAIREVFAKAQTQTPFDGKVARQHLSVGVMDGLKVAYSHAGRSYTAWLLGDDMQVVAPDSPLTDAMKEKVKEALGLWKSGDEQQAALALRDALDMAEKDADCGAAYDNLRDRIPEKLEQRGKRATTFARWIKQNSVLVVVLAVVLFSMAILPCMGLLSLALRR